VLYFELVGNVFHGRSDNVFAARPFAKIDEPATFAAEREVRDGAFNRLLAGRAFQFDLVFARHGLIVSARMDGGADMQYRKQIVKPSNCRSEGLQG